MKRRIAYGILALCLALIVAGCGKSSEEQQAADSNQDQLDEKNTEVPANEDSGEDGEGLSDNEEKLEETVAGPLPEFVNSEWYECKLQIYDMVFNNDFYATEEDIRKIVEGSAHDVIIDEGTDSNGEPCLGTLYVDGELVGIFSMGRRGYDLSNSKLPNDMEKYGLIDDGYFYTFSPFSSFKENGYGWYDKASTEFADFETRDDVLAYLSDNGFVEVDRPIYDGYFAKAEGGFSQFYPDNDDKLERVEAFADIPQYSSYLMQSITLYRIHTLSETNQEIERMVPGFDPEYYSGAHLNLVNCVTFRFYTDGTIESMTWGIKRIMVMGEKIR